MTVTINVREVKVAHRTMPSRDLEHPAEGVWNGMHTDKPSMARSSLPACAGLERPFGNSEGGGASLHLQSMPRVLERCTGHFEHHDGLLNHILHQDISAVGREGHPLRPMTDGTSASLARCILSRR